MRTALIPGTLLVAFLVGCVASLPPHGVSESALASIRARCNQEYRRVLLNPDLWDTFLPTWLADPGMQAESARIQCLKRNGFGL
jgi:hypothetical protein